MQTKHFLNPAAQQTLLERELLVHSVQLLPPGSQIVELGTGDGGTTQLLLEAGREWDVRVATVDRKHDPALRSSLGALGIECLRGDTAAPQSYWSQDRRIDFLLVDAGHTYAAVKADWQAWREYLNPHAFVFFHGVTPALAGEFVFVWDTIFQKEIGTVRGAGALLGGRFAMPGPCERPPLTPLGEELFCNLMYADLRVWPHQWIGVQPPKPVRRAGRAAGSRSLVAAATYALGLEEPGPGEALSLVVSEPADLLVQQLGMQGCRPEQVLSAAPMFREMLPTALFRDRDERFFELFPPELQAAVRTFVASLEPGEHEALAYGGLDGRVRLLEFVDERLLCEVAERFASGAGDGLGGGAGTVGAGALAPASAGPAETDWWGADPDTGERRTRRGAGPTGRRAPGAGVDAAADDPGSGRGSRSGSGSGIGSGTGSGTGQGSGSHGGSAGGLAGGLAGSLRAGIGSVGKASLGSGVGGSGRPGTGRSASGSGTSGGGKPLWAGSGTGSPGTGSAGSGSLGSGSTGGGAFGSSARVSAARRPGSGVGPVNEPESDDVPKAQTPAPPPPLSGVHPISEWAKRSAVAGRGR